MRRLLIGTLFTALAATAHAKDRALLIGVADYENNPAITDLEGPRNDVSLIWRMLKERGMAAADITVLTDGLEPSEKHPAARARPTRDNILAEFERLAKEVEQDPGGSVVLYYSGHGAYQLDSGDTPEDEPEPNGYDQVLLPADAGSLDPISLTIERAIVDDEIGQWLDRIRKHAFVWAVFDACHSGTVTRGQDVTRGIDPLKLLPDDQRQAAAEKLRAAKRTTRGGVRSGTIAAGAEEELAGFYAVDAQFQAIERSFAGFDPDMVGKDRKMGVFTYHLLRTLSEGRATTYRELAQQVVMAMKTEVSGGAVPAPVFDGGGLDRPIIGTASPDGAPRPAATYDGSTLAIKAGSLRGFDVGARIFIYSLKDPKEPIGYADIDEADAAQAKAVSIKWRPSVDQPDEGEDVRVAVKEGAVSFRFIVSPPTADEEQNDIAKNAIELAFGKGSGSEELGLSLAGQGEAGDVLLHVKDGRLWIRNPRKPWITETTTNPFDLTPSLPIGTDPAALAKQLKDDVWRLAKAAKLVRVAGAAAEGAGDDDGLRISAQLYRDPARAADPKADCGAKPDLSLPKTAIAPSEPTAMANCDFVEIKITNESETTYFVSGLYVEALGAVKLLDPRDKSRGCVRRLYSGQDSSITYKLWLSTWDADTNQPAATGEENIAILAIPQDETNIAPVMCTLIQPSISAAQETRAAELSSTRGTSQALSGLIGGIAGSSTRGMKTAMSEDEDGPRVTGRVFVFDLRP
jgi:hypothetical protein